MDQFITFAQAIALGEQCSYSRAEATSRLLAFLKSDAAKGHVRGTVRVSIFVNEPPEMARSRTRICDLADRIGRRIEASDKLSERRKAELIATWERLEPKMRDTSDWVVLHQNLDPRILKWEFNPWCAFDTVSGDAKCKWIDNEEDPHEWSDADLLVGSLSSYCSYGWTDFVIEEAPSSANEVLTECFHLSIPLGKAQSIMRHSEEELKALIKRWPSKSRSRDLFWHDVLSKDPRRGTWTQDNIREWPDEEWDTLRPRGKQGRPRLPRAGP